MAGQCGRYPNQDPRHRHQTIPPKSSKRPQQAKTSKPPSISSNRKIFPVETLYLTRQQVKIFKAKTGKPHSLVETTVCFWKKFVLKP